MGLEVKIIRTKGVTRAYKVNDSTVHPCDAEGRRAHIEMTGVLCAEISGKEEGDKGGKRVEDK